MTCETCPARAITVGIRWPDGTKENVTLSGVNRIFRIAEGKGSAEEPLK